MRLIYTMLWVILSLLSMEGLAQEHLVKTLSVTPAIPLNGKGFNLSLHYHLNSFDEFRGGFSLFNYQKADTLRLATHLFHLDYVKGFKFKRASLNKFGYYLGIGLFTGKEQPILEDGELREKLTIFGLRPFTELEWVALPQLTLISRIGYTFAFTDKVSKNLELALGTRLYF